MAKKMSIMSLVSTKVGILTAFLVVIFGIIFIRSAYELVSMFLKDMIMSFGITNDYQVYFALGAVAFIVIFIVAREKLNGFGK